MNSAFAWLGLPLNASKDGGDIDQLILSVHILMFALFAGWIVYFFYVLFRFHKSRHPKADNIGVTTHASSYIEALVAIIEGVLLIGMAIPIWTRTSVNFPPAKDSTNIRVIAQQFQWNGWYPGTNGVFVKADPKFVDGGNPFGFDKTDRNFKSNFTVSKDLVVPVNKPVIIYLSSMDVIHSFSCRPLRVMQDAIPGVPVPLHFTPVKTGTYQINCAQLCGVFHYGMRGTLTVVEQKDYDKWIADKTKASGGTTGGFE